MMVNLLVRGMLVGAISGVLVLLFAEIFGEPQVVRAIAFEEQSAAAEHEHGMTEPNKAEPAGGHGHDEEELVSRGVQSTLGLGTAVILYGAAIGGLFALAFAAAHGRLGSLGPQATSALLAALGFIAVYLIPALKYPPNPPAVGDPDTIGLRSGLYLLMVVCSLVALAVAARLRPRFVASHGAWNGTVLAVAVYLVLVVLAQLVLPAINEVP
jgi:predicted cobalt transporter CbtA